MLQGNSFETERWVEERTKAVQHGVEGQGELGIAQGLEKVRGWLSRIAQGRQEAQREQMPAAPILSPIRKSQTN